MATVALRPIRQIWPSQAIPKLPQTRQATQLAQTLPATASVRTTRKRAHNRARNLLPRSLQIPRQLPGMCLLARSYYSSPPSSSTLKPSPTDLRSPTPLDASTQPATAAPPESAPTPSGAPPNARPSVPASSAAAPSGAPPATATETSPRGKTLPDGGDNGALPSQAESRRSLLSARFSHFMDELQARVLVASQALNDLTGYSAIEGIKARNAELEDALATAQAELRTTRRAYQTVNERRASTQREVTTLLARKDSWAPADLERFTELYRADHELEAGAQRAVDALQEAEATEARLSAELTAGILKRYHEEQVWSDRIRRQSTWGTWGLMAVNVLLFLVLQVFAEPWRRARLMRSITEAESSALDAVHRDITDIRAVLAALSVPDAESAHSETQTTAVPSPISAAIPATEAPPRLELWSTGRAALLSWSRADIMAFASTPAQWKAEACNLCSERLVSVRVRDLSLLALQSAAAGVALVGGLVLALRRS